MVVPSALSHAAGEAGGAIKYGFQEGPFLPEPPALWTWDTGSTKRLKGYPLPVTKAWSRSSSCPLILNFSNPGPRAPHHPLSPRHGRATCRLPSPIRGSRPAMVPWHRVWQRKNNHPRVTPAKRILRGGTLQNTWVLCKGTDQDSEKWIS